MKNKNDVSDFRKECEDVSARFAAYPWEYLMWMGEQAYEAARDEMKRRHVSQRIQSLIDGALLMMLAAEQIKAGRLEPVEGLAVAEALPPLVQDIVKANGGWPG